MIKKRTTKRRKLAHEILRFIGISALIAAVLFVILSVTAAAIAEYYCFNYDVPMTEFDWIEVERRIFSVSGILAICVFSTIFLSLLADRMAYIRKITEGIDALGRGRAGQRVPLEGNNELTELAAAINDMNDAQQQLREKEQALAQEQAQLIRTLSHDIRTPLTSILAYSEYLSTEECGEEERRQHLQTIRRKAEQIRELTDILLDGGKRHAEHFENAALLMTQLAAEFEAELEDRFRVELDLSGCPAFAASFDVGELRRIFDNLCSNVGKYADPKRPVLLSVSRTETGLQIRQRNGVLLDAAPTDSYQLGIISIRRIAHFYGGRVDVLRNERDFEISIIFTDFL